MKTASAIFLIALFGSAAVGADDATQRPTPKPRVRLDPVTRAAAVMPAANRDASRSSSVVVMEKFVVQEGRTLLPEPAPPQEPTGRFSLLAGGYLLRSQPGKSQWEIGAWPWLPHTDVMAEDIMKFGPPKTRVDYGFVRVRW